MRNRRLLIAAQAVVVGVGLVVAFAVFLRPGGGPDLVGIGMPERGPGQQAGIEQPRGSRDRAGDRDRRRGDDRQDRRRPDRPGPRGTSGPGGGQVAPPPAIEVPPPAPPPLPPPDESEPSPTDDQYDDAIARLTEGL